MPSNKQNKSTGKSLKTAACSAKSAKQRLAEIACPDHVAVLARFFKTGPGEYGEGDVFIGIRVPAIRKVAKDFKTLPLADIESLLHSKIHEERLLALMIMSLQFEKSDAAARKRIFDLYLANTRWINNWDLVDLSSPRIVGGFLADRSRRPLHRLAKSSNLWERRISIVATHWFIRQGDFQDTLTIADVLLRDEHDLIHKAVGWMLREVGKRDETVLEEYLLDRYRAMPRTMLRYAIERFPEKNGRRISRGLSPLPPHEHR